MVLFFFPFILGVLMVLCKHKLNNLKLKTINDSGIFRLEYNTYEMVTLNRGLYVFFKLRPDLLHTPVNLERYSIKFSQVLIIPKHLSNYYGQKI